MKKRKFTLVNTLANEIEKGSYQKVSVTTICDEVGCSRQNFYYYFDSIDEAIKELVDVDIKDISDFQIKANESYLDNHSKEKGLLLQDV